MFILDKYNLIVLDLNKMMKVNVFVLLFVLMLLQCCLIDNIVFLDSDDVYEVWDSIWEVMLFWLGEVMQEINWCMEKMWCKVYSVF